MKINKYVALALGICSVAASVLATPLLAEDNSMEKFDPTLKLGLASSKNATQLSRSTCGKLNADKKNSVRVLVKTSDKGVQTSEYVKAHGGKVNSRHGNILSLTVPYDSLRDLGRLNTISRLEASQALLSTNDIAKTEIGTNLNNVLSKTPGYTGKGVVVGVLDTGIDTSCKAFNDASGKSRISYFWNMEKNDDTRYPTIVTPEGDSRTFSYGAEYTAADIDAQKSVIFSDPGAHGTHVCGTIAGRDDKYPGMAPEANYIVVNNSPIDDTMSKDMWTGSGTGATLDGLEYIISRAKEMDMPLVVNMSQGTGMGPHDGSTLFEQAIQADIEERNLIMCIASGNNQEDNKAVELIIPAGESVSVSGLFIAYPEGIYQDVLYDSVDIWYSGNPDVDMTISNGLNSRTISYGESLDEYEDFASKYSIACPSEKNSENGDYHSMLRFKSKDDRLTGFSSKLTFTNNGSEEAKVNLYLQRNALSYFNDDENIRTGTLGLPGTTPGAITVGAYTTRNSWEDADGNPQSIPDAIGEICPFSSQGPVRNSARYKDLNSVKPDIVAPGSMIISQKASGYNKTSYDVDLEHMTMQGTSMSCPAVTGTVALILQNMPNATAADIKRILFDTALSDANTGTVPNNIYGHGKLQASCIESKYVVSPKPTIENIAESTEDSADLVITGDNFTPAIDVIINGEMWPYSKVSFIDKNKIIVRGVFADDSPILKDGSIVVDSVKVINRLGKSGANSDEKTGMNKQEKNKDLSNISSGSGGCFIATAAYGSYLEPEVMTLRRFRDSSLITNAPGRKFVELYYTYSPPIAAFIAEHPSARFATRVALTPVVYSVGHPGMSLALALAFGIGASIYRRRRKVA